MKTGVSAGEERHRESHCRWPARHWALVCVWVYCIALHYSDEWRVEPECWKPTSELWQLCSSSLAESLVSVCLSISTSLSTLLHSTLPQTELMTSCLRQSMLTHIQQLPESTQTSPAAVVSQLHMPTGHCTPFRLYCLLSPVSFYAFFLCFMQLYQVITNMQGMNNSYLTIVFWRAINPTYAWEYTVVEGSKTKKLSGEKRCRHQLCFLPAFISRPRWDMKGTCVRVSTLHVRLPGVLENVQNTFYAPPHGLAAALIPQSAASVFDSKHYILHHYDS